MATNDVIEGRNKRTFATRAAARISSISATAGVCVDDVSWQSLSVLPEWCLLYSEDQSELVKICGSLTLASPIQSSIDGVWLRRLCGFIGQEVFDYVRSTEAIADSPLEEILADEMSVEKLELQVTDYGVAVFLSTLDDKTLVKLYTEVFRSSGYGVSSVQIEKSTAQELLRQGMQLLKNLPVKKSFSKTV